MAITLHAQAPVTVGEAKKYLQDQGFPADGGDLLKMHINGVTGLMLALMGRDHMKHTAGVELTEYYRGYGDTSLYLCNAPVQNLVSVTLLPHDTSPTVLTGPGIDLSNDDMWYDRNKGLVTLKNRKFADVQQAAKVIYEAGFASGDSKLENLRIIALDAIAAKWKRWKDQKHGVSAESKGETSITYSRTDFDDVTIKELKRHKRTWLV